MSSKFCMHWILVSCRIVPSHLSTFTSCFSCCNLYDMQCFNMYGADSRAQSKSGGGSGSGSGGMTLGHNLLFDEKDEAEPTDGGPGFETPAKPAGGTAAARVTDEHQGDESSTLCTPFTSIVSDHLHDNALIFCCCCVGGGGSLLGKRTIRSPSSGTDAIADVSDELGLQPIDDTKDQEEEKELPPPDCPPGFDPNSPLILTMAIFNNLDPFLMPYDHPGDESKTCRTFYSACAGIWEVLDAGRWHPLGRFTKDVSLSLILSCSDVLVLITLYSFLTPYSSFLPSFHTYTIFSTGVAW